MTKTEKKHLSRVAALGCMLCQLLERGKTPAEIHHPRKGQGMGQRAGHFLAIPLCPDCHRGPQGVHGDKTYLRIAKVDEYDLLDMTIEALA